MWTACDTARAKVVWATYFHISFRPNFIGSIELHSVNSLQSCLNSNLICIKFNCTLLSSYKSSPLCFLSIFVAIMSRSTADTKSSWRVNYRNLTAAKQMQSTLIITEQHPVRVCLYIIHACLHLPCNTVNPLFIKVVMFSFSWNLGNQYKLHAAKMIIQLNQHLTKTISTKTE